MAQVTVERGRIIVYRIVDVADSIDLAAAERGIKSTHGPSRLTIARSTGHALVVRNAPLTLTLSAGPVRLGEERVMAERFARLWDYGAMSIQFHIEIRSGTSWRELVRLAALAEDDNDFDDLALRQAHDLMSTLAGATKSPHEPLALEDYIVYLLEKID